MAAAQLSCCLHASACVSIASARAACVSFARARCTGHNTRYNWNNSRLAGLTDAQLQAWSHRKQLSAYVPHWGLPSTRTTDTFALLGSVFLFMYWPSFNAALATEGPERQRAIVNTVLSLCAAALAAMAASSSLRSSARDAGRMKLDPWDLANGILGGGVAIGAACTMQIGAGAALLIGGIAGVLTVCGFAFVQPFVQRRFGIHDSCGVQSLHGMSGVFGALASAVAAGVAKASQYSGGEVELAHIFPMRADHGAGSAAGAQLAALATTIGIAAVTGVVTGYVMQLRVLDGPRAKEDLYTDRYDWVLADAFDEHEGPELCVSPNTGL